MKRQTGFWKGFGTGLLLTALVVALGVTAFATSRRTIEVEDGIGISLNGATFIPWDANGREVSVFLYNGTTYVPVRAVSEAMGMDVQFNSTTRTVQLTTADRVAAQQPNSGSYITEARARQIALTDAGVQEANAVFLRCHLDWDDGRAVYDVEFYSGNTEYDYEIDAITGTIRSSDRDMEDFNIWTRPSTSTGTSTGSGTSTTNLISETEARNIALNRAPAGTTVVRCHLDWDDGRYIYELDMRNGWTEYECEINAQTGVIVQWDVDYWD